MIVFDLDGCLIDSEEMIRQSYKEAGAEAPPDFLSLGHHEWISDEKREAVHVRKNAAYLRRLATETVWFLPPWHTAQMLRDAGYDVAVLTGAPEGALSALTRRVFVWPFMDGASVTSPEAKTRWLAERHSGVYVDDQEYVDMPDGWRFVRYTGQRASELYAEVTR